MALQYVGKRSRHSREKKTEQRALPPGHNTLRQTAGMTRALAIKAMLEGKAGMGPIRLPGSL